MEATYIKVDQREDALGEAGLIPNHHPLIIPNLSIPTLVSPEDWGSPSNTAGYLCTWHSFFFFFNYLFIYLFIFGCVGSSFLCEGFL